MKITEWAIIIIITTVIAILGILIFANTAIQTHIPVLGSRAPDFCLSDQSGHTHRLSEYQGRWVVLFFYPKDGTRRCTQEACSFREVYPLLRFRYHAAILGISVDDIKTHHAFAEKHALPYPILSDPSGKVAFLYGSLWRFGLFNIARRNTFLISPRGYITNVYIGADPSHNAQEIMRDLSSSQDPGEETAWNTYQ